LEECWGERVGERKGGRGDLGREEREKMEEQESEKEALAPSEP
jgi:hypothetical protein